jgi:C-terminal processing protease CtpA/Prc
MQILHLNERKQIVQKVHTVVANKTCHPGFNQTAWQNGLKDRLLSAQAIEDPSQFESHVDGTVRELNLADSGFVHKSHRKTIPKGVAARFQYCTPNECSPTFTTASQAGDIYYSKLTDGVGWLKVTKFPGAIGIDISRQIDHAICDVGSKGRVILDLRGNAGGGLAFLRVMSYLTPDRLPVGYSVTRYRVDRGYTKQALRKFDWIPSSKLGLYWLAAKYMPAGDDSVALFTEGLGAKPWHQRIVIIVDQHTTGAGERIAAFAQERRLAPIIGQQTAGRLICSSWFRAGHDYFVRLPARLWLTWTDQMLEGSGIVPDVPVELGADDLASGQDPQLEKALETVRAL